MPLDFPSSPTNGQTYGNYYYDGPTGAWRSFSSTINPIPSTLKNLTISSGETTGVSLKVTPFTTSSVNLQEWYNTSSNVVASINVAGDLTANSLTLTTDLSVANGGTGTSTFTSGAYLKGAGSSPITAQTGIPGEDITSGQVGPSFGGSPTGGIMQFAGSTAPTGWLLCEGQAVSRTTFASLFASIGTTYGAGDGSTTFNVPNLKGRVPAGRDTSQTEFDVLGETSGTKTVTLDATQIPAHNHTGTTSPGGAHTHTFSGTTSNTGSHSHTQRFTLNAAAGGNMGGMASSGSAQSPGLTSQQVTLDAGSHEHTYSGTTSGASANHSHTFTTENNTGGGLAHNNLQPYIVLNYIIKT
jgi:microcystin-dependent protein